MVQLELDEIIPKLVHSSIATKKIKDDFTKLPISRQRKYQLRMKRDGRCISCGEPTVEGVFCLKHCVERRERTRKKIGAKRRWKGALSYRLEEMKATRRRHLKK